MRETAREKKHWSRCAVRRKCSNRDGTHDRDTAALSLLVGRARLPSLCGEGGGAPAFSLLVVGGAPALSLLGGGPILFRRSVLIIFCVKGHQYSKNNKARCGNETSQTTTTIWRRS